MSERRVPAAPAGLGAQGKTLWKSVVADFELTPAESRLLAQACRAADELDRLTAELDQAPTVVAGSMGQAKPNPLFAEVRHHRTQLAALLKQLDLIGAEDEADKNQTASVKAMRAARARWGQGRVAG